MPTQPARGQHVVRDRDRGREREQRREGQVLEQQDAEREPGVRPRQLELIAELAHDDRGGGHGDRAAEHDRDRQRGAERPGGGADAPRS